MAAGGTRRIQILAIDVDGTLLNRENQLSPRTKSAVHCAAAAGLKIVLASGRRYRQVLHLVEPLQLESPLITASGALIKQPPEHRTLFRAQFPEQLLGNVCRFVHESGFDTLVYADTFDQGFDMFCVASRLASPAVDEFFAKNRQDIKHHRGLYQQPPADAFACFAMGTRDEMHALEAKLLSRHGDQLAVHVLRSPRYRGYMCEIAPPGVDKWTALSQLAADWNLAPDTICAVGDDVNDVTMIRHAGLGVAMGNAVDDVKNVADRVAPTNDQDGLEKVVQWILR